MGASESSAILRETGAASLTTSPVRILALESSAEASWDRFVFDHPSGSFFHQIGWKRVIERTYGYQPFYFYGEREGRIAGIAPSFFASNWITGKCLMSLPFAVYGGICASDPESEKALVARLEQLALELQVEYLELRNRRGQLLPGYHSNTRYATFTMPLISDVNALYQSLPKDIRYMIRKGEKAGLEVRRGFDQLKAFYKLLTVSLRRLGTPTFPRSLFEQLIQEYPGQVDLAVVYSSGKPVSGGMSFRFREWMQPYYIGSLEEAKVLAANNFLWWDLIKHAARTGHSIFDFGRSKKGSGNFDFKKKWGPQIESLDYQVRLVHRTEPPDFSPANPKFQLATNMWKKMPLSLTRIIGPHVVRWFP